MTVIATLRPLDDWAIPTKTFINIDGNWLTHQKTQPGEWFEAYEIPINNLKDLYEHLNQIKDEPVFIVSGELVKDGSINPKRMRRTSTSPPVSLKNHQIKFLPLDIDGYECDLPIADPKSKVENYIFKELPKEFHDCDYVFQTSASYGLQNNDLRAHVFFELSETVSNESAIEWTKSMYKLDKSVVECYQPIYTQNRKIIGEVPDPCPPVLEYIKKEGRLFYTFPAVLPRASQDELKTKVLSGRSQEELVKCIVQCIHPVHESIRDWIKGQVCDSNRAHGHILGDLMGMTSSWPLMDLSLDHLKYRDDFDRQVKTAIKKYREDANSCEWNNEETEKKDIADAYTKYPNQEGVMEEIVQSCLDYSVYPSRPLAVLAGHALISLFCGRSHCDENDIGIVFTCLLTGRSTIGKSFAKKYIKFVLNNFDCIKTGGKLIPRHHASEYVGSGYYTSVKNMEAELSRMPSMISFVSESGHMGKSKAGDMPRVAALEFNLATETGPEGSIESGGQNDLVAPMYSPGFTCFKECTPKVQRELDIANSSDETGVEGRRSHAIMNPIRPVRNYNRIKDLPDTLRKLCMKLHTFAKATERQKLSEPHSSWIIAKSEDPLFMRKKEAEFRVKGDEAHMRGDEFTATYFGRLEAKATAWATRLAIAENPDYPLITNQHYEIALESLMAEHRALLHQFDSGELDTSWPQIIPRIVSFFKGNMTKNKTLKSLCPGKMLDDHAATWTSLRACLGGKNNPILKELMLRDNFPLSLEKHLRLEGIVKLHDDEAKAQYGRANVFKRID